MKTIVHGNIFIFYLWYYDMNYDKGKIISKLKYYDINNC